MEQEELALQKAFRYIEWISIAILAASLFAWASYVVQFDQLIAVSLVLFGLESLLVALMPKSPGRRFVLLIVQTLLITAASALSVHQRSSLYFLILGAKAALFLPGRQMLSVAAMLLCGRILAGTISLSLDNQVHVHRISLPAFYNPLILETENKLYFAIALFTVLFLGRTLVAERRSRNTQQELAKEAEKLAVDLERNKIAVDINDKLAHILASQLIQLELATKLVQDKQLDKATALVTKSYDSSVQCLQELRKAVAAIRTVGKNSEAAAESASRIESVNSQ